MRQRREERRNQPARPVHPRTSSPYLFAVLFVFSLLSSATHAHPVAFNETTATTAIPGPVPATKRPANASRYDFQKPLQPIPVTARQWRRLISTEPMITRVAFDTGPPQSRIYAYVTAGSYKRYMNELEVKCRRLRGDNIADVGLDSLDYEYFRWEEYEFNKALQKTLFPEIVHGDYRRFISSPQATTRLRFGTELENQCRVVKQVDNWSERVDEKTLFEDFLINRVFQPRHEPDVALAILRDIEIANSNRTAQLRLAEEMAAAAEDGDSLLEELAGNSTMFTEPPSSSLTDASVVGEEVEEVKRVERTRRSISSAARRHLENDLRERVRQYKIKRQF